MDSQNSIKDSQNTDEDSKTKPVGAKVRPDRPKTVRRVIVGCGVLYTLVLLLLVVFETVLVYPGTAFPLNRVWETATFDYEEIEFSAADGTKLVGWYLPQANADETILLCHGNAEDVARCSDRLCQYIRIELNANVFVFDYRGYGKSEGSPTERGVLDDTESAMAWLNERTGTEPDDIIVIGHSLGGGPAVHVASQVGAKILVLQRTFSSMVDVAQERYWFLPVQFLMRNRFLSAEKLKECDVPLFESHGTEDTVVPYHFGRTLFESSPAKLKQFYSLEGGSHFSKYNQAYLDALSSFVEQVDSATER